MITHRKFENEDGVWLIYNSNEKPFLKAHLPPPEVDSRFTIYWNGQARKELIQDYVKLFLDMEKHRISFLLCYQERDIYLPPYKAKEFPSQLEKHAMEAYSSTFDANPEFIRYELYPIDSHYSDQDSVELIVWAGLQQTCHDQCDLSVNGHEMGVYTNLDFFLYKGKVKTIDLIIKTTTNQLLTNTAIKNSFNEMLNIIEEEQNHGEKNFY